MTVLELKGWDELLHPRGPGGEFAPKDSAKAKAAREEADKAKVDAAAASDDDVVVTVEKGDTLYELAEKYLGDGERWREIAKANGVEDADPRKMPVGIKLTIPGPVKTTDGADPDSVGKTEGTGKGKDDGKGSRSSRRRKPPKDGGKGKGGKGEKPKLQEDEVPEKAPSGARIVDYDGRTGAATYADGSRIDADGWRDDKVSDEEVVQLRVRRTESRRRAGMAPLPEDTEAIREAERRANRKSHIGGATTMQRRRPVPTRPAATTGAPFSVKSSLPPVADAPPSGGLSYKALSGTGCKVLDEGAGIVEAIVSVTGYRDEVKDVIEPGAYERTLSMRRPKGVSGHDWLKPVAKALEVTELNPGDSALPTHTNHGAPWPTEAGAVKVLFAYNLDTQLGRDTYSNVKFYGAEQEWSIGYNVPRGRAVQDHKSQTRFIKELDLYEWSDVLFGAMPLAGTQSVKGLLVGTSPLEQEVKYLPGSREERQQLLDVALSRDLLGEPTDGPEVSMGRGWVSIIGTFDDHVVVRQYGPQMEGETLEWRYGYEVRDGAILLGTREPVKVTEQVTVLPATNVAGVPADDAATDDPEEKGLLTLEELRETDELWAALR